MALRGGAFQAEGSRQKEQEVSGMGSRGWGGSLDKKRGAGLCVLGGATKGSDDRTV